MNNQDDQLEFDFVTLCAATQMVIDRLVAGKDAGLSISPSPPFASRCWTGTGTQTELDAGSVKGSAMLVKEHEHQRAEADCIVQK